MKNKELFSILLKGFTVFYLTLATIMGLMSLGGILPAKLNEHEYYGVQGLLIYVLFAPFVALLLAVANWVFLAPGLFIYSWISDKVARSAK